MYGMLQFMDLYEQATLAFIFGRTCLFKKEWEFIPLRHFMKGVWGRDGMCVAPRIRISEASLLKAIASLEAKKIIEVDRSFRKNRYRIRTIVEIENDKDYANIWQYIILNQPALLAMMAAELESRRSLLDAADLRLLSSFQETLRAHKTGAILNGALTGEVNTTPSVREQSHSTTSPMREHKIPISRKKKEPNIALAPQSKRRPGLTILPRPLQKKSVVRLKIRRPQK